MFRTYWKRFILLGITLSCVVYWTQIVRPLLETGHRDIIQFVDIQGPQELCIFGMSKSRSLQVQRVLRKLNISGYNVTVHFSPNPEACPATARIVLRLHSHVSREALPFRQDIEKHMPENVVKVFLPLEVHKNIRGYFMRAKIPGKGFKTYISVNDMTAPELAYLAPSFEGLLLEELYQAISGAVDITVKHAPRSILEERLTAKIREAYIASGAKSSAAFHDQLALSGDGLKFAHLTGRFSFRDQAASVWITTPSVRALPTVLEGIIAIPIAAYRFARIRLCNLTLQAC